MAGTRVGDVLASKYRLEELLGSGGMGQVYRAVNVEIDRAVAIKVLRSEHATNAPILERFLREARAANLVRHPNVVDVVDVGRDGDGSPFIVQELLEGEDLSKYVERRGGKLALGEIEELVLPVIDAVAEAHAHGVVHRDIKPENVFLAQQGKRRVPKLLDFGISKVRLPNIKATEVGVMMGTPAYMAPEQIQGSRDADPRSDVWALGILLFELLAGRLPFEACDAPALFVAIATKDVPRLIDISPEVSPAVSQIVERCLRRLPEERYPSALELARDFRHMLDGTELEPTQTRSIPPAALTPRSLDIPDLVFPASRTAAPELTNGGPAAAETLAGSPAVLGDLREPVPRGSRGLALNATELSAPAPSAGPKPSAASSVPDLAVSSSSRMQASRGPASAPIRAPAPSAPSSGRIATDQALSGVMLAGVSAATQRRPSAHAYLPVPAAQPTQDMSFLIGLAVVGLLSIGATAVLMTFLYQPEGWPLVQLVTKPSSALNLVVQGGLGLVAFVFAGRFAVSGVKKWRGEVAGGRGTAVVNAVVAGGLFFVALQLARAAW